MESRPVITTIEVPYSISTAAADAGDVKKGDIIVDLSKSFKNHLLDLAKTNCGAPAKRDALEPRAPACANMGKFMEGAVGDGAPGGLDIITFNKPVITANDIENGVRKFFATGRALYRSRLFIGGITIIALGLYLGNTAKNMDSPIHIPNQDLGEPKGNTVKDGTSSSSSGSSGSSCKATKTGKETPICDDKSGCDGMAKKTCEADVCIK